MCTCTHLPKNTEINPASSPLPREMSSIDSYKQMFPQSNNDNTSKKINYKDFVKQSEIWARRYIAKQTQGGDILSKCMDGDGPGCLSKRGLAQQSVVDIAKEVVY